VLPREEHVQPELRDVLELPLGRGVVERHDGVLEEAKERVAVVVVVANRRRERLARQQPGQRRRAPPVERQRERARPLASPCEELFPRCVTTLPKPSYSSVVVWSAPSGAAVAGSGAVPAAPSVAWGRSSASTPSTGTRVTCSRPSESY